MTAACTWIDAPGVTRREAECMGVIDAHMRAEGVAPAFREMAAALGVSKSMVHRTITSLHRKGFIRRLPNRKRAIELTKPVVHDFEIPARAGDRDHGGPSVGEAAMSRSPSWAFPPLTCRGLRGSRPFHGADP